MIVDQVAVAETQNVPASKERGGSAPCTKQISVSPSVSRLTPQIDRESTL